MSFFINNSPNRNPQLGVKLLGTNDSANERIVILSAPQDNSSFTDNVTLTFPPNDGTSGQVLSTDGDGNLSWTDNQTLLYPVFETSTTQLLTTSDTGYVFSLGDPTISTIITLPDVGDAAGVNYIFVTREALGGSASWNITATANDLFFGQISTVGANNNTAIKKSSNVGANTLQITSGAEIGNVIKLWSDGTYWYANCTEIVNGDITFATS